MRRWWRSRLPVLVLIASYAAAAAVVAAFEPRVGGFERSIDVGGFDNNIEDEVESWHPHAAPGKPSKLDLDVSQYTETDDKGMFELESQGLHAEGMGAGVDEDAETSTTTTEATTANSEKTDRAVKCGDKSVSVKCIEKRIDTFLRTMSTVDTLNVTDSVQIVKRSNDGGIARLESTNDTTNGSVDAVSLVDRIRRFARDHVVEIKLSKDMFSARRARTFFGAEFQAKNTFLTGFGLGFLAFGLKKLLLPLFIGVQIIKSILIALFLPSIIGSIGKIVGKGVTSFAQSSQNPAQQMEENYEFKDNQEFFGEDYMQRQPLGTLPASVMYEENMLQAQQTNNVNSQPQPTAAGANKEVVSRFGFVDPRLTDRYYTRHVVNPQATRQDFKVFHEIPTSSLLLTNYDPYYSPLLSRIDSIFSRLGYNTEECREYLVCAMYRNPARFMPSSNLVSTQLSRELNELRKPSADNPEVLRFFHYMKAAKDGQDGLSCQDIYANCEDAENDTIRQNQAMLATYQDIDKLVHARKL